MCVHLWSLESDRTVCDMQFLTAVSDTKLNMKKLIMTQRNWLWQCCYWLKHAYIDCNMQLCKCFPLYVSGPKLSGVDRVALPQLVWKLIRKVPRMARCSPESIRSERPVCKQTSLTSGFLTNIYHQCEDQLKPSIVDNRHWSEVIHGEGKGMKAVNFLVCQ